MGRVTLWLDPEDLRWLAARCCCGNDEAELERERCARVRFRASAALHKAAAGGGRITSAEPFPPCGYGRHSCNHFIADPRRSDMPEVHQMFFDPE
jgi:hypothetical protein